MILVSLFISILFDLPIFIYTFVETSAYQKHLLGHGDDINESDNKELFFVFVCNLLNIILLTYIISNL